MLPRLVCALVIALSVASFPPVLSAATSKSDASSFQWGTYRPNLYFGVRAKNESSPIFGLLWGAPFESVMHVQELRHDAEERDKVSKYGWLQHDGDSFGVQEIIDKDKNVNMTTTFINVSSQHAAHFAPAFSPLTAWLASPLRLTPHSVYDPLYVAARR